MDVGHNPGGGARQGAQAVHELLLPPAAVLEGLPDAVVAARRDGQIVFVNALAEELFGYRREQLLGQPVHLLWPERVRERYKLNMQLYFATEHPMRFSTEAWGLRRDGSEFVGEMSWGIVETPTGPLLLAIGRDITQRRAKEARLRAAAAMGERALAGADPTDLAAEAVELMRTTLPIAGAEVRLSDGVALASFGPTAGAMVLALGAGDQLLVVCERELGDEEMSLVRAIAHTLGTALARIRNEERMRHEAVHDPLTGLPNRTLLRDRLDHALARVDRGAGASGLLFVDLDNFKYVNDAYGHAAGDAVLIEVARRLCTTVRAVDTVARLGGDEFVVVCEEVDQETALALGRRLQDAIQVPVELPRGEHRLTASIGIAIGERDPEALLDAADAAAYEAKHGGGGRVVLRAPGTEGGRNRP
jgi:diguanylate cyclase (GGDEF)-like protein/PAS domain S-box-containing protein